MMEENPAEGGAMSAGTAPPAARDPALHRQLQRWVEASLITSEQADSIEELESRAAPSTAARTPLLTEALIYVGGGLAGSAAAALLGPRWQDLAVAARTAAIAVGCAVTFLIGLLLRRSEDPAMARVTSVAWAAATGLSGWLAGQIVTDVLQLHGRVPGVAFGLGTSLVGAALYAVRPRALQQIAFAIGVLSLAGSAAGGGTEGLVVVWGLGAAWALAGGLGVLRPPIAGLVGGPIVALWAPLQLEPALGMWLGLATAIGLTIVGVAMHRPVMLGLGAFGVFVHALRTLTELFGDTAAMPIALLTAGTVALVLGLGYARRERRNLRPSPPRSPS